MKKLSVQMTKGLLSFGAIAIALGVSPTFAQDLTTSVTTVHTGISAIPNIIAGACYIAGAAVLGAGLMKLKAHAENAAQTPIGHGLGRVVIGGALLAAPAIGTWVQTSVGTGTKAATSLGLGAIQ